MPCGSPLWRALHLLDGLCRTLASKTSTNYAIVHDIILTPTSYISLPEEPPQPASLPRSRTFSNLPPSAKTLPSPSSLPKSQSHMMLPLSRIPTPCKPTSSRSATRFSSATKGILKPGRPKSLVRSDTEPLLTSTTPRTSRATAFKENLSISPVKRLPKMELFDEEVEDLLPKPLQPTTTNSVTRRRANTTAVTTPGASPLKPRRLSERVPTPPTVRRGYSHPIVPTANNKKVSYGTEIKQRQLLSARQPPTPPPHRGPLPETPVTSASALQHRLKAANNSGPIRKERELSPCSERSTPAAAPPAPLVNPEQVKSSRLIVFFKRS